MAYRTDLAMEAESLQGGASLSGVRQYRRTIGNLEIQSVHIDSEEGASAMGKPPGDYITVMAPTFSGSVEVTEEEISQISDEIMHMLPPNGLILVVGLGNNDITPDAIGPRTVHQVLATRHITPELAERSGLKGLRPTAALAPGVLGQTGIETSEIIRSVVEQIRPTAVIVIDALAARSASRLGNTIQIASSGISPGSGVMNARRELSRETLGVPVVSVGIPTVVDAATLAEDLLDGQSPSAKRELVEPGGAPMMITPREIDVLIEHGCKVLALAINKALQPQLTLEEIGYLAG